LRTCRVTAITTIRAGCHLQQTLYFYTVCWMRFGVVPAAVKVAPLDKAAGSRAGWPKEGIR
jgi:hypothetical protein